MIEERESILDLKKANLFMEVIKDINASLNLEECLKTIITGACKVLDVEIGSIMLIDKSEGNLKIKAAQGLSEKVASKITLKLGEGISGFVAKEGIPLLIKDIEKDSKFSKKGSERYYTNSLLSIPLKIKDEVVGVLNVNNKKNREVFNNLDLEILSIFGNHASIAIEKARLYEEKKKEAEELSILTRRLEANKRIISQVNELLDKSLYDLTVINEVNEASSTSLSVVDCAKAIFKVLNEIIDYLAGGIFLVNEEDEIDFILKINSPISFSYLENLKGRTLEIFNRYYNTDIHYHNEDFLLIDKEEGLINKDIEVNLNSFHGSLLRFSKNFRGLLALSHKNMNAFAPEDIRLIEIVSKHGSIALENASLYEKIEYLAITDELTRLYNYRYFSSKLEDEILRSQRYNKKFSLIIIDIDNFKNINDNYGHKQGDLVLKNLANIIKVSTREVNILARYGGEEFAIILPEENMKGARIVAERIRKNIERYDFPPISRNKPLKITISLGISEYPTDGTTEDQLVKSADQALYRAKALGKNRVCCARRW